jgi:CDP-4-dehydro-6-deoxyglucose reductase
VGRPDHLVIEGPAGDFVLDADASGPLLLVAVDTGFAPVRSLAEHALTVRPHEEIDLLWLTAPGGHYLDNLLRAWDDAFDGFRYRSACIDRNGPREAVAATVESCLRELAGPGTIARCTAFVAAEAEDCDTIAGALAKAGVDPARLRLARL